jgi:VanZ family protein
MGIVAWEAANAASLLLLGIDVRKEASMTDSRIEHNRLRRYVPLILWMALIFFASTDEFSAANTGLVIEPLLRWLFPHISDERVAFVHFLARKSGHFTEYAVFGLLAARAFISSTHVRLRRNWFLAALLMLCLYALFDEYHQSFVPSRTGSIYDSLLNMTGGLTAFVFGALWRKRRRRAQNIDAE